jgi:hypothetical protein
MGLRWSFASWRAPTRTRKREATFDIAAQLRFAAGAALAFARPALLKPGTLGSLMAGEIVSPLAAAAVLQRLLLGDAFTIVNMGDCWALSFSRFWLISQEIRSPHEQAISRALEACRLPQAEVDPEDVPRVVAVTASRRRPVVKIAVDADASLRLEFGDASMLTFPTDVPFVDWFWALTTDLTASPHSSYAIACFAPGEIQMGAVGGALR